MNLKMIVSAFCKGNTPQQNAQVTTRLVQHLLGQNLQVELAVGCYNGVQEISMIVTGWPSVVTLEGSARYLRGAFGQECVYVSFDGVAKLIFAQPHQDKRVGKEVVEVYKDGKSLPENYTRMLNGKILYTVK